MRNDNVDYKEIVHSLTMEYARRVIGDECDKLEIVFSDRMKYFHARCYPFKLKIIYNTKYLMLNKDSIDVMKYTVIEECAHLRYIHHSAAFYKLCKELGYDVRYPPSEIKYYWKYFKRCRKCRNGKIYYHKPHTMTCQQCGSDDTEIIKSDY
jgi:predicted metal-dependent hydrolase